MKHAILILSIICSIGLADESNDPFHPNPEIQQLKEQVQEQKRELENVQENQLYNQYVDQTRTELKYEIKPWNYGGGMNDPY